MPDVRSPVTYDDVKNAVQLLQISSEKISTIAIREKIGRGSFTTIRRHLDQWLAQKTPDSTPPVPQPLETFWLEARKAAEAQLAADREGLEQISADLESRLATMTASVQDSENRRLAAETRIQDKEAEIERLNATIGDLRAQRDQAIRERIQTFESAEQERVAWAARLEGLTRHVGALSGHLGSFGTIPAAVQGLAESLLGAVSNLQGRIQEQHEASNLSSRAALKDLQSILSAIATHLGEIDRRSRIELRVSMARLRGNACMPVRRRRA
jgi:chromosome segregation ATPase